MRTHYGHLARVLHTYADQTITAALAEMDLTAAQGHILGYLSRCQEPPCARDLEQVFQLSHPTVSGLLSRLEKKDFIRLEADDQDRRCKRICLLPRGQQCNQRIHALIDRIESQLVADFTEEEKQQFQNFLLRAIHNLKEET